MRTVAVVVVWLLLAAPVAAATWPTIDSIRLRGNAVTRASVIERELTLAPGNLANPEEIERNRQAVMDLGLFRDVTAQTEPTPSGAVVLILQMREKRFLLPLPHVGTNSDKDVSYGAQLRWANVGGRNHRLNLTLQQGRFPNDQRREREREVELSYFAPHLGGSDWGASARTEVLERVTPIAGGNFEETFHRFEALALHDLTSGRPRRGWRLGGGVLLEDQRANGVLAPPSDGQATALVGVASFDDLRFHGESETGRHFNARLQGAAGGWGSDYSYSLWRANYFQSRAWGKHDHQTWHLLGLLENRSGGPGTRNEFDLGGSGRLRGYESDFLQGNRLYYGALEVAKPLWRDWLRGVVLLELGGVDGDRAGQRTGSLYPSIGLGVRMRLIWFVDLEIELGIAYPLRGDGGARFFAGGN